MHMHTRKKVGDLYSFFLYFLLPLVTMFSSIGKIDNITINPKNLNDTFFK